MFFGFFGLFWPFFCFFLFFSCETGVRPSLALEGPGPFFDGSFCAAPATGNRRVNVVGVLLLVRAAPAVPFTGNCKNPFNSSTFSKKPPPAPKKATDRPKVHQKVSGGEPKASNLRTAPPRLSVLWTFVRLLPLSAVALWLLWA